MDAQNMYRREINKYIEQNCAPSCIYLRDCKVLMVMLRAGRLGVWIPTSSKYLSPLLIVHTDSEAHPDSYSLGTGVLSWSKETGDVRVPTHLYLEPRLWMSGAIPLPKLLIFMKCSGINLSLYFFCIDFCMVYWTTISIVSSWNL